MDSMLNGVSPGNNEPRGHHPRKRGTACTRCRLQKVRCGNQDPDCFNCVRAGVPCTRTMDVQANRLYTRQLELRNQWLEDTLRKVSPRLLLSDTQEINSMITHPSSSTGENKDATLASPSMKRNYDLFSPSENSPDASTPAQSATSEIGPSQPLAHDVGLLSLGNQTEPKYLGPSSGVTFARLIFAAAPQSQGLPSSISLPRQERRPSTAAPTQLPKDDEMRYFIDAYFETWHTQYPFLPPDLFEEVASRVQTQSKDAPLQHSKSYSQYMDDAQVFLVLALGARVLESRLSSDFSADSYYATAILHIGELSLHDSIRGVQTLLLLVLSSFSFTNGLNAWFLSSTIITSCLDLGLQRKHVRSGRSLEIIGAGKEASMSRDLRSAVFWSAYSLDRTLCVILGRPLTLRDEALDIEFPGEWESTEVDHNATDNIIDSTPPQQKRQRTSSNPCKSSIHLFRFDRITAEIKLMLHRVAQSPDRFPWPTDLIGWQQNTLLRCHAIYDTAQQELNARIGIGTRDHSLRHVELKYHQCLLLLTRPSPAIPRPSTSTLSACYSSAVATIRIQADLARFSNMLSSWLTAHAVFVAGLTILYCIWTSPSIRKSTDLETFMQQADSCTKLLETLSKTWSVAESAKVKFDHLVEVTKDSWKLRSSTTSGLPEQTQSVDATLESQVSDNMTTGIWEEMNLDYVMPSSILVDELGDMGSWFDLDWLGDMDFDMI